MINSRQKGKRIELFFKNDLKDKFPDIERNANVQSRGGGLDLINTNGYAFEVKGGKATDIKKIRDWLDQLEKEMAEEKKDFELGAILCKPDRKDPYVIMSYKQFKNWI